ncbi:Os03g0649275, partial [Oryza sativa Japonica Group]
ALFSWLIVVAHIGQLPVVAAQLVSISLGQQFQNAPSKENSQAQPQVPGVVSVVHESAVAVCPEKTSSHCPVCGRGDVVQR